MAETAAPYDLELVQGETYERTFRWKIDGAVQTLTGYTIRSQVRQRESTASTLLLDLAPYCTLEPDGQTIRLRIPANITAALTPRSFKAAAWDLFLLAADPADTVRLLEGNASCDPAATEVFA